MEESVKATTYADVHQVSMGIIVKLEDSHQRLQVVQNLVGMVHANQTELVFVNKGGLENCAIKKSNGPKISFLNVVVLYIIY